MDKATYWDTREVIIGDVVKVPNRDYPSEVDIERGVVIYVWHSSFSVFVIEEDTDGELDKYGWYNTFDVDFVERGQYP